MLRGVDSTVDRDGRLVAFHERLVRNLERAVNTSTPHLSALAATEAAAASLDLEIREPLRVVEGPGGSAQEVLISRGGISLGDVPAHLVYFPVSESDVRLAWSVVIRTTDHRHWWQIVVDAVSGDVHARYDWITQDSYRVNPLPLSNADEAPRTLEVDPADPLASPFGWHDTDGIVGPELTDTTGNNVRAQEDADTDDLNGTTADGGATLSFDFPFDPDQPPQVSELASITQLFFLNNQLHDVFYRYGFDEDAGNFQENNYGHGGFGADPVIADTLDGAFLNNANFGTPPEGESPRMQMFVFYRIAFSIDSPAPLAGTPPATPAQFGPVPPQAGLSDELAEALDPSDAEGTSVRDACSPLTNGPDVAGKIALIERGTCDFVDKVRHAQDAGAIGAVIYNNAGDGLVVMGGDDPTIVIPSIFVAQSVGVTLRDALPSNSVEVTLASTTRDPTFDNEIVVHEYMHGVTNRLTGGPTNVLCLQLLQSGGLGEGWSDFAALAFTQKPGGVRTDPRRFAAYSLGNSLGPGIRRFPYSTDLSVNPLTLEDLPISPEVHDIGEIWAVTLWEMYWNLVDAYGFDPDVFQGSGGNNIAFQLVMDGLELQPCSPTFTSARDAILQADLLSHAGANRCAIWEAFARRGVGMDADARSPGDVVAQASFAVPPDCLDPVVQDAEQQRCIYAMNEGLRRVMAAQGKSQLQCVRKRASDSLSMSTDVCLIADTKGTVQTASDDTEEQEQRSCSSNPDFGKTNSVVVNNAGFGAELGLIHDIYGASLDSSIVLSSDDPAASRCQTDVAKSVARCRNTQLRAFNRCKKNGLASEDIQHPTDLATCLGDDPRLKIARACDASTGKVAATLAQACGDPGLDLTALFPGCGAVDVAQCLERIVSCRVCAAVARADALGSTADCDLFDDGAPNSSCGPLP